MTNKLIENYADIIWEELAFIKMCYEHAIKKNKPELVDHIRTFFKELSEDISAKAPTFDIENWE